MKRLLLLVLAGTMLLSACGPQGEGVQAEKFWVRSGMKDGNSAGYMLITNYSDSDVSLTGASSDVAGAVEVHLSSVDENGMMQMAKQDAVLIPAGRALELKPGSYHLMFVGLTRDLNVGDEISLSLHFEGYDDVVLTVPVQDAADMGGSGMDGHNMP